MTMTTMIMIMIIMDILPKRVVWAKKEENKITNTENNTETAGAKSKSKSTLQHNEGSIDAVAYDDMIVVTANKGWIDKKYRIPKRAQLAAYHKDLHHDSRKTLASSASSTSSSTNMMIFLPLSCPPRNELQ